MPTATRAETRAARERAKGREIPYTQALSELRWIRQLLDDEEFETADEADAYVTDPANQIMCNVCGWTYGMVCPECSKGCGCATNCTGWRHGEWGDNDNEPHEPRYAECGECGGEFDVDTGYGCACR